MRLFNNEKAYDHDHNDRLDAGEYALWEAGNPHSSGQVTLSFSVSGTTEEFEEDIMEHPSPAYARIAIGRGALADPEEIELCEVLLWDTYPQVRQLFELDDLPSWKQIMKRFLDGNPALAVSMWRTLLDCAQPVLMTDEETAMVLCTPPFEKDWILKKDEAHLRPFVDALKEGPLAVQVFQCAYVGGLQHYLLEACCVMDERETAKQCLDLLMSSQYPQASWHMPLWRYRQAAEK